MCSFKPDHPSSLWSLESLKNPASKSGMTHTESNYEYDLGLWSEMHERSSIKSSACHTESLFRLSKTQLLRRLFFYLFFAAKEQSLACITNSFYLYSQAHASIKALELGTFKYDFMIWSEDECKHFQKPSEHVWLAKMDGLPVWLHYTNRAPLEDVIKWSL